MKKIFVIVAALFVFNFESRAQFSVPLQFQTQKGLTCDRLPFLMHFMATKHYSIQKVNEMLTNRSIEEYLKFLDGSKTLLLKEDIRLVRKHMQRLMSEMKKGNCEDFDVIRGLVLKRAKENELFIKNLMGADYKFNENVVINTDPDKREYASSAKEKNDLLEKFAHFQISNYLLNETKLDEARKLLTHRYELISKRLEEKTQLSMYSDYLKAFAGAFDPHTGYFAKEDFEDFQIQMKLSLEGIGASLSSQDGFTVVEEIIPGGAADRANVLKRKDKIVSVSQVKGGKPTEATNVVDMDLQDVVRLIRGKKGSKVQLTILRQEGSATNRLDVTIVRDKIDLEDQAAKLKVESRKVGDKTLKLGVLDLPSFYGAMETGKRSAYHDMRALLVKANKQNVDGILLNLRQNGGGLLDGARLITGLFLKQGPVVATKDTEGNVRQLIDEDDEIVFSKPLVVLTSRASASAAEILPGALKDYNRALIVGADHTFGKGSVQQVEPFAHDMGAVKITTALYFLPGGSTTQHQGVKSHIVLPSILQSDKIGEATLDYSLPPQKITPFIGTKANSQEPGKGFQPITEDIVKKLSKLSADRIKSSKEFADVQKELAESKKNEGVLILSDFRKKAKEDKAEESKTVSERKEDLNAPYVKEGLNILIDLINEVEKKKSVVAEKSA